MPCRPKWLPGHVLRPRGRGRSRRPRHDRSVASPRKREHDVDAAARRECLSALVSASRPMRSRWCSCDGVEPLRHALDSHIARARRVPSVICARPFGQRAREVPALERLRPQVERPTAAPLPGCSAASAARRRATAARASGDVSQASRDGFELQRDARQALLERVVQLAPHAAALVQDGLVLLPLPVCRSPGPRCRRRRRRARASRP